MAGGVNICHVNRASSNIAPPPLYLVRLFDSAGRGISRRSDLSFIDPVDQMA